MSEQPIHRRYVMLFAVACLAILLPVLVLNYLLGLRSLGGVAVVLEASRWQQETRGVTYAPPLSANRPFKSARLFDRLLDGRHSRRRNACIVHELWHGQAHFQASRELWQRCY